mmetsp:Transcript_18365/g.42527  ORF Transcript_18365/g.42527 Transcript_18365/m.42527 type:complete len:457 (-) Transcript_18365:1551-2921(-)
MQQSDTLTQRDLELLLQDKSEELADLNPDDLLASPLFEDSNSRLNLGHGSNGFNVAELEPTPIAGPIVPSGDGKFEPSPIPINQVQNPHTVSTPPRFTNQERNSPVPSAMLPSHDSTSPVPSSIPNVPAAFPDPRVISPAVIPATAPAQALHNGAMSPHLGAMPGNLPVPANITVPTNITVPMQMQPAMPNGMQPMPNEMDMQGMPTNNINVNSAQVPHVGVQQGMRDGVVTPPPSNNAQTPQVGDLKAYSDAMEKLCESMKRSAMSRSLVRQLSGRSLTKQGSNRSLVKQDSNRSLTKQDSGRNLAALARQSSGRNLLQKQSSGRNLLQKQSSGRNLLQKQSSGRNLMQKQHSGRNLMQRQNSGRSLQNSEDERLIETRRATRRPSVDSKHRITRDALAGGGRVPGRGVFRHKSSSALMGRPVKKTTLQLDDTALGVFHSEAIDPMSFRQMSIDK